MNMEIKKQYDSLRNQADEQAKLGNIKQAWALRANASKLLSQL